MTGETVASIGLGVIAGVAATVTMDVLGSLARSLGLATGAKGQWVGRWHLGTAPGRFVHSDITTAPKRPGENGSR
jgi:hypothetical protein